MIKDFLSHPLTKNIPIDDPKMIPLRRRIIQEKTFLKRIYQSWYQKIIQAIPEGNKPIVEVGSGAGFLNESIPHLITSEVFWIVNVDLIFNAMQLPFENDSLRSIVMVDVLHHIPNVHQFFSQANRCLCSGGRMLLIEPWVTTWSSIVYQYLHHEPFLPRIERWEFPRGGPLSGANSALPWIIFKRDKVIFEKSFPKFQILDIQLMMPFTYLLSGGVSYRDFMPSFSYPYWIMFERWLHPWMNHLGMFAMIIIEKK